MKLEIKNGNLLDVTAGHIVHGVNSQGVMNSGVAKYVREKYPNVYKYYIDEYKNKTLKLGNAYRYAVSDNLFVWNAVTQEFYGNDKLRYVSYDAVESCFSKINNFVTAFPEFNQSINIPMIGSGLGGGNWNIIKAIIEETVIVPVTVWVL
jgi:O-acetyl-ADP-ribose deacetylase (regulator of RNase III)